MKTIELKVDGMTCGSCVASVARALRMVPGVREATVDLRRGIARVTAEHATQRLPAFGSALAEAGYKAGPLAGVPAAQQGRSDHKHGAPASGRGGCCSH